MCVTRFNSIIALSALICADLDFKPMEYSIYFSNANKGDFELGVVACAHKLPQFETLKNKHPISKNKTKDGL